MYIIYIFIYLFIPSIPHQDGAGCLAPSCSRRGGLGRGLEGVLNHQAFGFRVLGFRVQGVGLREFGAYRV